MGSTNKLLVNADFHIIMSSLSLSLYVNTLNVNIYCGTLQCCTTLTQILSYLIFPGTFSKGEMM